MNWGGELDTDLNPQWWSMPQIGAYYGMEKHSSTAPNEPAFQYDKSFTSCTLSMRRKNEIQKKKIKILFICKCTFVYLWIYITLIFVLCGISCFHSFNSIKYKLKMQIFFIYYLRNYISYNVLFKSRNVLNS